MWTLAVDISQSDLGIRDDKLFDTRFTGPLTQLVSARVEDHVRISVHERTEMVGISRSPIPGDRRSFRRFVTFCDNFEGSDGLDCSIGATRIKARATSEDLEKDGYLDASMHEISYFDGVSRLHVMSFMTPYSTNLTRDMSHWIEAINAVSDVLNPRMTSSIIR